MDISDFQKNIVQNLRGFYLTQIISYLGKSNYIDSIISKKKIDLNKDKSIFSKKVLKIIFDYFCNVGFSKKTNNYYILTELGKDVLKRYSSYFVPHSYKNYFYNLEHLLKNDISKAIVDREENILGSGKTHLRYFIQAISFIKRKTKATSLIDIGIGNADFAINLNRQYNLKKIFGVDYSKISVLRSIKSLNKNNINNKVIQCDGANVKYWSKKAKIFLKNENIVISLWFLIHEISNNSESKIIKFLNNIKKQFPGATIIICELVNIPYEVLSNNKESTFIPEYLLFHQLSSQGVLSIEKLNLIIKKSNYKVIEKINFDEMKKNNTQKKYPSCVLLFLK